MGHRGSSLVSGPIGSFARDLVRLSRSASGAGHVKGDLFDGGLLRGIGHGKVKFKAAVRRPREARPMVEYSGIGCVVGRLSKFR